MYKKDSAFKNLRWLIGHKTEPNKKSNISFLQNSPLYIKHVYSN